MMIDVKIRNIAARDFTKYHHIVVPAIFIMAHMFRFFGSFRFNRNTKTRCFDMEAIPVQPKKHAVSVVLNRN
jgi:hypothetical protein